MASCRDRCEDVPQRGVDGRGGRILGEGEDVVGSDQVGKQVAELVGDGIGGFATPEPFPVGAGPKSITWGDFNDDGVPDLVTANGTDSTASVLPSNP